MHGLHNMKEKTPLSLTYESNSTKIRAAVCMKESLQVAAEFRCIYLCKSSFRIQIMHNLLCLLSFQVSIQFRKNSLDFIIL